MRAEVVLAVEREVLEAVELALALEPAELQAGRRAARRAEQVERDPVPVVARPQERQAEAAILRWIIDDRLHRDRERDQLQRIDS